MRIIDVLMANEITLKDETTEFLLYTAPNGEVIDNPDDLVIFCSGLSNRHSRKPTNLTHENVYIKSKILYLLLNL